VRNCDFVGGLAWFACLPLMSGAMGAALGVVVGLLRPWRRAWVPSLLAIGGIATSIGWGLLRYWRTPPVFGYDPFVGYFPGALYDEDVAIGRALLWARCYHAAVAGTALAACAMFLDLATLSARARALPRYVLARQLFARDRFNEVIDVLSAATDDALPDDSSARDRERLLAQAAFHVGDYARARELFARGANYLADPNVQREAADWRDRCDFAAAYKP